MMTIASRFVTVGGLLAVICFQYWTLGQFFWRFDLSSNPDEASHLTSGVMTYDYVRTLPWSRPLAFAKSYYARFPKVGIGNWPPLFYGVQAAFYLVFGAGIAQARLLALSLTLALAAFVFWRTRLRFGEIPGLCSAALVVTLPVVRGQAFQVMSDILTALLVLTALEAMAVFLECNSRRALAMFVAATVLAVLSKGSAWALGIFAALAPLAAWRLRVYWSGAYYMAGLTAVAFGLPFYLLAQRYGFGYHRRIDVTLATVEEARWGRIFLLLRACPWYLLLIAAVGIWMAIKVRQMETLTYFRVLLALPVAELAMHMIAGVLPEPRYYVASAAVFAICSAPAIAWASNTLAQWRPWAPSLIPAVLAALWCVQPPSNLYGFHGYHELAERIPPANVAVLIASDALGEGAFIVERLLGDPTRANVVVRSSKALASSDWNGYRYRELVATDEDLVRILDRTPVHYIAVEVRSDIPHVKTLEAILKKRPDLFQLLAVLPIQVARGTSSSGAELYRYLPAQGRPLNPLRFGIGDQPDEVVYTPTQ